MTESDNAGLSVVDHGRILVTGFQLGIVHISSSH
jgi:hypothetical protein